MKLLKSQIEQKTGAGFVTLLPEEPEDMVLRANVFRHYYADLSSGTHTI